MSRLSSIPNR